MLVIGVLPTRKSAESCWSCGEAACRERTNAGVEWLCWFRVEAGVITSVIVELDLPEST